MEMVKFDVDVGLSKLPEIVGDKLSYSSATSYKPLHS